MKSSELRVAILQTDEVLPQFLDDHGDYPDMFARLLHKAVAESDSPIQLRTDCYDARVGDYPAVDAYHGYLITGSRKSVYDDEPWIGALADYLKRVLDAGGRVIGICFGHQLMAHFFGGRTEPAVQGWAVGVQENRVVGREPWMDEGERLNLLSSHKDQVTRLPEGARLIASSDLCPVGGFVIDDQVLTLQGHPEFQRGYSRDLMDMRREIIGEAVYSRGLDSLCKETDDDRAGRWIISFLTAVKE